MSRSWFRRLFGVTNGSRPVRRKSRPARLAVEFLETRNLLSYTSGLIGGGLVGDPVTYDLTGTTSLSLAQWDVNLPYTGTITGFGASAAQLQAVSGLPAGLRASKSGTTITFAGTPTQTGTFYVSVDTVLRPGTATEVDYVGDYYLTINPQPSLGALSPAQWTVGQAGYSGNIPVRGGTGGYNSLTLTGRLPPGLTLQPLSGSTIGLSGTPTTAGTYSFALSLKDGLGVPATDNYVLPIRLALSPGTLPADTAGQYYSAAISASGGSGRYSFALVSGALPAGMSLSSAGVLKGTPTVARTYNFTVQATDLTDTGATGTRNYALTVNPGPAAQVAFSAQPPASVVAGTTFSPVVRVLDALGNPVMAGTSVGISISPGALSGGTTPIGTNGQGLAAFSLSENIAGSYVLTASVPGLAGVMSSPFAVTPAAPKVVTVTAPPAPAVGSPFGVTITVKDQYNNGCTVSAALTNSDGLSPQTVPVNNGTGTATVTLTNAHTVTLTAAVTAGGVNVHGSTTVTVQTVPLTVRPTTTTLPGATVSQPYTATTFTATGGSGHYSFALASGVLPKGLLIKSTGELTGMTFVAGTYHFTVRATDTAWGFVTGVSPTYTLAVSRMTGTVTSPTSLTSSSSTSGNVTATVGGNGTSPTVQFQIGTPSGVVGTNPGQLPMTSYAISPNHHVGIVIPPLTSLGPVVALYNLGFDPLTGGPALGSQIGSALFGNWYQFWFSPDETLLVIINQAGTSTSPSATLINLVSGGVIGNVTFSTFPVVTSIDFGHSTAGDTVTVHFVGDPNPTTPTWTLP